jgi:hypothetical protein
MIRPVRLVKWGLSVIAIGWAVYSANIFKFLAWTFPSPEPVQHGIFSSIQGYAVVFGPVIVALFFLMIRWPETSKGNSKGPASR